MAGITYQIDPTSEDATNVALTLVNNTTHWLIGEDLPAPPEKVQWASSADTEGALRAGSALHDNRTVSLTIRLHGSSAANIEALIEATSEKVEKLRREGGTLQRTMPSGNSYLLDILAGSIQPSWNHSFVANWRSDVTLSFTARPYWRAAWRQLSDHTETSLPHVVFTETTIKGDVPALGRLVVDNDASTVNQNFLMWGIQSRYYSSATSAALFYEAEGRTAHSGSTVTTRADASGGASNNVLRNAGLTGTWQSIMSTQATGGGAHLTHTGTFRVWARVNTPPGIDVRLSWAAGDFMAYTTNAAVATAASSDPSRNGWRLLNLGMVVIPKVSGGTQQWEGRIEARSDSTGATIDLDCLYLMPVDEGYGEARSVQRAVAPTSTDAHDEFDQSAGALTGQTAAAGGNWAGAGDTDDFAVNAATHTADRTAVSDTADTGRFARLGSAQTAVAVSADVATDVTATGQVMGVLARYTDTSNWLYVAIVVTSATMGIYTAVLKVRKSVAGTESTIATSSDFNYTGGTAQVRIAIAADGTFLASTSAGGLGGLNITGSDSSLATGGALDDGTSGIYDENPTATAATRSFDNFTVVGSATPDAVAYASQSVAVRNDEVIRENSAGAVWSKASKYAGDYLRLAPAGAEGRTVRVIVKMSREDPDTGFDDGIDDVSARLTVAERFVHVPE